MAAARRSVRELQAAGEPVTDWLGTESRYGDSAGNAATVAVLEIPGLTADAAADYVARHPDRGDALRQALHYLPPQKVDRNARSAPPTRLPSHPARVEMRADLGAVIVGLANDHGQWRRLDRAVPAWP